MGDVITVAYMKNELPFVRFSHRINQVLDCRGEKVRNNKNESSVLHLH